MDVPLIANIAPAIIQLIAALVHKQAPAAEAVFGPGTGPVKFADVFGSVVGGLTSAANAGQIDKSLPPDDQIKLIIQSVVSSMIQGGLLGQAQTPATPTSAAQTIALVSGQSVTITVK